MQLLKQKLKQTYKIHWSCYDWKHEGLKPLFHILEDILYNHSQRKWLREKIWLLKKRGN